MSRHVGHHYLTYEQNLYDLFNSVSEDYHRGYWHYCCLSNDGFYIERQANYFEGEMSTDAAAKR